MKTTFTLRTQRISGSEMLHSVGSRDWARIQQHSEKEPTAHFPFPVNSTTPRISAVWMKPITFKSSEPSPDRSSENSHCVPSPPPPKKMNSIKITVIALFTFSILITVSFRVISSIFPYCTRKSIIRAPSVTFSFPLSGSAIAGVTATVDAFVIDGTFAVECDDCRGTSGIGGNGDDDVIATDTAEAHSNDTLELVTNVACRFSIGAGIFQEPAEKEKLIIDFFLFLALNFDEK